MHESKKHRMEHSHDGFACATHSPAWVVVSIGSGGLVPRSSILASARILILDVEVRQTILITMRMSLQV